MTQDLEAVWDAHVSAEFEAKDADATVATMVEDAWLLHVPVATGARGREALRTFYAEVFIPSWPDDTAVETLARTVGTDRVVDELIVRCTHSRMMDFWLPGVAPTGRRIEIPTVAVVGFEGNLIQYEHIYWDQASLLAQVGVLDASLAPMLKADAARVLTDPNYPLNALIARAER
jgi:carboxymethylenebutenolidase